MQLRMHVSMTLKDLSATVKPMLNQNSGLSIPCARELGHAAAHKALHNWLSFNSFSPRP